MSKPANLRDEMPLVTAFIDNLRSIFGAEEINAEIRKGMHGIPVFWACEGGHEVGTRAAPVGVEISAADLVLESINREKDAASANRNHRR